MVHRGHLGVLAGMRCQKRRRDRLQEQVADQRDVCEGCQRGELLHQTPGGDENQLGHIFGEERGVRGGDGSSLPSPHVRRPQGTAVRTMENPRSVN